MAAWGRSGGDGIFGRVGRALAGPRRRVDCTRRLLALPGPRRRVAARIPPGDLALPVERLAGALWRLVAAAPEAHHGGGSEAPSATRRPGRLAALLTRGEAALSRWELAGIALLALAVAVALVVSWG